MAKRVAISSKTRFQIFKRDLFSCQYCGRTPPIVILEVDHVIPVCEGGTNDRHNLVTSCFECNNGKGGESLDVVPAAVSEQLAVRLELESQVRAYNRFLKKQRERIEDEIRQITQSWYGEFLPETERRRWCMTAAQRTSLKTFLARLPCEEILEAVEIAHSRHPIHHFTLTKESLSVNDTKTWKYFCGVCWTKIKRREQK